MSIYSKNFSGTNNRIETDPKISKTIFHNSNNWQKWSELLVVSAASLLNDANSFFGTPQNITVHSCSSKLGKVFHVCLFDFSIFLSLFFSFSFNFLTISFLNPPFLQKQHKHSLVLSIFSQGQSIIDLFFFFHQKEEKEKENNRRI